MDTAQRALVSDTHSGGMDTARRALVSDTHSRGMDTAWWALVSDTLSSFALMHLLNQVPHQGTLNRHFLC